MDTIPGGKLATASTFGRTAITLLNAGSAESQDFLHWALPIDSLVLHVLEAAICVLSMVNYQPMLQLAVRISSQDTMFNCPRLC